MESKRKEADADSTTSPGSNYQNIKEGNYSVSDEQKQISKDNDEYQKGADKTKAR